MPEKVALSEKSFLKRTTRARIQKERHFLVSELFIKLIEPTFKKIYMCVQKMKMKGKGKSLRRYFLLFFVPPSFTPSSSLFEKQTGATYGRSQLLLQYNRPKVS